MGERVTLISGVGKTIHVQKMKLNPYLTKLHSQKLIQNGLELNIIPETI